MLHGYLQCVAVETAAAGEELDFPAGDPRCSGVAAAWRAHSGVLLCNRCIEEGAARGAPVRAQASTGHRQRLQDVATATGGALLAGGERRR